MQIGLHAFISTSPASVATIQERKKSFSPKSQIQGFVISATISLPTYHQDGTTFFTKYYELHLWFSNKCCRIDYTFKTDQPTYTGQPDQNGTTLFTIYSEHHSYHYASVVFFLLYADEELSLFVNGTLEQTAAGVQALTWVSITIEHHNPSWKISSNLEWLKIWYLDRSISGYLWPNTRKSYKITENWDLSIIDRMYDYKLMLSEKSGYTTHSI